MSKKAMAPSKSDLLTILRQHERREVPKVVEADRKSHEASQSAEEFLRSCKPYQTLKRRCEALRRSAWKIRHDTQERAKRARTDCYDAVRLYGATPAVVCKIKQFLKQYP